MRDREILSDALAAYDTAVRERETAEAVCEEVFGRGLSETAGIDEIMDRIGAEQACMRASMAEKIAQAKLIGAVRAALHGSVSEDGARPKVLATGWLRSMGRRDGEERGPVVEFVIDASQQHAMTFGDIWNGHLHQIAALAPKPEGRTDRA